MLNRARRWTSLLSVLPLALCLAPWTLLAADFGSLTPQGYVSDYAQVLDEGTKSAINNYCARVEQATGAQIALVTLPSLEGEPVEDVANLLYRKWGVGSKKTNEGVLVLLSIRDHRSRVEVGYGLEPYVTDGFAGGVLRQMRPALRRGDYGQALVEAASTLGATIAQAKGVAIPDQGMRRHVARSEPETFPWHAILVGGGVLLAFLLFGRGGRGPGGYGGGGGGNFLLGMLLGNLLSSGGGYRTRGGGGFGGYDSGDSFGGFGGGDSGGGGASSDW